MATDRGWTAAETPQAQARPGTVRLYYYTARGWGLQALWERRLKIARYQDVNDPYDLVPFDRSETKTRAFWDAQVEKLFEARHGMICFSEDWRNLLMWSSYGDKHTGICLGFDVLRECAVPVTYLDQPLPPPKLARGRRRAEVALAALEAVALRHKHAGWRGEREWRVRAPLVRPQDGVYYQAFDDGLHLREVILGARCPLQPADVVQAVQSPPLDVDVYAARAAYDSYAIERHELVSTHTVPGYRERLRQARAVHVPPFHDDMDDGA